MQPRYFIAGDWGTSSCCLYLFENGPQQSRAIDQKNALGAAKLKGQDIEAYFFKQVADWLNQYPIKYVVLSGMVGSSIGWQEAGYAVCPADQDDFLAQSVRFTARSLQITILGGLKTRNPLGLCDTMRGEEVQLLGVSSLYGAHTDAQKNVVAITPGTHNKWSIINGGRVDTFFTNYTGELYSVLDQYSILTATDQSERLEQDSFIDGVKTARNTQADTMSLLFSVRAKQLVDTKAPTCASSYLLGLIVGQDLKSGLALIEPIQKNLSSMVVIGRSGISQSYQTALTLFGVRAILADPDEVFKHAYPILFNTEYKLAAQSTNDA